MTLGGSLNRLRIGVFFHDFVNFHFGHLHYGTFYHKRSVGFFTGGFQFFLETFFGYAALVVAVLAIVHGQFKQLFVVFAKVPFVFFHFLTEFIQRIGELALRVAGEEFPVLFFGQFQDFRCQFSRQFSGVTQNHIPRVFVYRLPALFTLEHMHEVHQSNVFHILAERSDQRRIPQFGPYVFHFLEEAGNQVVKGQFLLAGSPKAHVYSILETSQVCHHGSHHAAGQAAAHQERCHDFVTGIDEQPQEIVNERLRHGTRFHIGFHIDVFHLESGISQHGLHGDDVRMDHAPAQRFHGHVHYVHTGFGYFQHRGHGETRTGVPVVLYQNMGVFLFDFVREFAQHGGTTYSGHVFQGNFVCPEFDQFVHY